STDVGTVTNVGGNNFQIDAPLHTYTEEGAYNVQVNVTHETAATLSVIGATITVDEVQITNLTGIGALPDGNEGAAIGPIIGLATFTDPAGAEVPANYTTLIHWGDGSTDPGTVVATGANTLRVDAPAHTYAEEGNYTITLDVTHEAAATLTINAASLTVDDVQIANLTGAGATQTINEGDTAAGEAVATFTDPAGAEPVADYTATIDFGDGSGPIAATVVNVGGNNFQVNAPAHAFLEEGTYNVNVSVTHDAEPTLTVTGATITVNEVQVTNFVGANATQTIDEGGTTAAITPIATFTDPAGAEPVGNYTAVIDFGDGSGTVAGTVVNIGGNDFQINAPGHTYTEEGAYSVNVSVTHETAATLTVNGAAITVNEVQIANLTGSG